MDALWMSARSPSLQGAAWPLALPPPVSCRPCEDGRSFGITCASLRITILRTVTAHHITTGRPAVQRFGLDVDMSIIALSTLLAHLDALLARTNINPRPNTFQSL